jgi:hypothetical protein
MCASWSRLAGLGVPDTVAEQIIGHGRKGLARVYNQHQYEAERRDALERWAARLRSIVEPPPENVVFTHQEAEGKGVKGTHGGKRAGAGRQYSPEYRAHLAGRYASLLIEFIREGRRSPRQASKP